MENLARTSILSHTRARLGDDNGKNSGFVRCKSVVGLLCRKLLYYFHGSTASPYERRVSACRVKRSDGPTNHDRTKLSPYHPQRRNAARPRLLLLLSSSLAAEVVVVVVAGCVWVNQAACNSSPEPLRGRWGNGRRGCLESESSPRPLPTRRGLRGRSLSIRRIQTSVVLRRAASSSFPPGCSYDASACTGPIIVAVAMKKAQAIRQPDGMWRSEDRAILFASIRDATGTNWRALPRS